jgi:hypothetical protein
MDATATVAVVATIRKCAPSAKHVVAMAAALTGLTGAESAFVIMVGQTASTVCAQSAQRVLVGHHVCRAPCNAGPTVHALSLPASPSALAMMALLDLHVPLCAPRTHPAATDDVSFP